MKVWIIRHGESVDDIENCYGGIADFELTDGGMEQARALGRSLRAAGIQCLYSSPLRRALNTAHAIATEVGQGLKVIVVEDLHERNSYGVLSGVEKTRAATLFARELVSLKEKPGYSREPLLGAEDFDIFVRRVRRAFESVCEQVEGDGYDRVGIVTHGKFTQALFEFVFKLDGTYEPDHGVATVIEYRASAARMVGKVVPAENT